MDQFIYNVTKTICYIEPAGQCTGPRLRTTEFGIDLESIISFEHLADLNKLFGVDVESLFIKL